MDLATLQALGNNPIALAGLIFGLNSTIKRNISAKCQSYTPPRKEPPAWVWWLLSGILGVLGAFVLHLSGFGAMLPVLGATGPAAVVAFGLSAAATAVFGRDAFKTALSWVGSNAPGVQVNVPPVVTVPSDPAPQPAPDSLRPITPEEAANMTRLDWPAIDTGPDSGVR